MILGNFHFLENLGFVELQIIRDIVESEAQRSSREEMKEPVGNNLRERIIDHDRLLREPAADGAVISFGHGVEEIAHFRDNLHEIAVHRQNILAGCGLIAIS